MVVTDSSIVGSSLFAWTCHQKGLWPGGTCLARRHLCFFLIWKFENRRRWGDFGNVERERESPITTSSVGWCSQSLKTLWCGALCTEEGHDSVIFRLYCTVDVDQHVQSKQEVLSRSSGSVHLKDLCCILSKEFGRCLAFWELREWQMALSSWAMVHGDPTVAAPSRKRPSDLAEIFVVLWWLCTHVVEATFYSTCHKSDILFRLISFLSAAFPAFRVAKPPSWVQGRYRGLYEAFSHLWQSAAVAQDFAGLELVGILSQLVGSALLIKLFGKLCKSRVWISIF